jgi:hypothetical protein
VACTRPVTPAEQVQGFKILNRKKGTLTGGVDARVLLRQQAKERLERNLKRLSSFCQSGVDDTRDWPSRELLEDIRHDVEVLAGLERKRRFWPVWKAFEHVDKRMKKLQLESRVSDLIRRARNMLRSESELSKAIRDSFEGDEIAQCSLRDLVLQPKKLARLLSDDRRMVTKWCLAHPLMWWAIEIRHPVVEDLERVKSFLTSVKEMKAMQRRDKTSERVRQYRKSRCKKK